VRRRLGLAAPAVAVSLALGVGLAGCGGSDATVTETVTTGTGSTATLTPPPATAPPATTASTTASAPSAALGADDLPPEDAVPGVRAAPPATLATATALVDKLYAQGDPNKPAAAKRFEDAGYAGGIVRDQSGEDVATGLALLRSYALALRDEAAAQAEVEAGVAEVRRTTPATITDVAVSDVPGARGLRVDIDEGGTRGSIVFVTFAAGANVYGLQGVSQGDAPMPQDEIVGAARDLYEKVTAAP
jgi:hypothetical protein